MSKLVQSNDNQFINSSNEINNSVRFGFFNPNTYKWPNTNQFTDLQSPVTTFKSITEPVKIQSNRVFNKLSNSKIDNSINSSIYPKNSYDSFDTNSTFAYSLSDRDSNMGSPEHNHTNSSTIWSDSVFDYSSLDSNLSSLPANVDQRLISPPINSEQRLINSPINSEQNKIVSKPEVRDSNQNRSNALNQININQIEQPRKITKNQFYENNSNLVSDLNSTNQSTNANLIQSFSALDLMSNRNVNSQNNNAQKNLNDLNNAQKNLNDLNNVNNALNVDPNQLIRWLNLGRMIDALCGQFGTNNLIDLLIANANKSTDKCVQEVAGVNPNSNLNSNLTSVNQSAPNVQQLMNNSDVVSNEISQQHQIPTGRISKGRRRALTSMECVFCKNNGAKKEDYQNHILKDPEGLILCPVLFKYNCPICNNGGGLRAHTVRYCPKNRPLVERRDQILQNLMVQNVQNVNDSMKYRF